MMGIVKDAGMRDMKVMRGGIGLSGWWVVVVVVESAWWRVASDEWEGRP
jgi:hypothetical protein